MVYSQVCEWLNDFIESSPPDELLDTWDCNEWIRESEIVEMFQECFLPIFKTKKAHEDATQIFHALLWEYFKFRKSEAQAKYVCDISGLSVAVEIENFKSVLTSKEFPAILKKTSLRTKLLRDKISNIGQNTKSYDNIQKFKPVIYKIYEKIYGKRVSSNLEYFSHTRFSSLIGLPDSICDGRLLEVRISNKIDKDNVPYNDYCKMQVDMEVCNIGAIDYCECIFKSGPTWSKIQSSDACPKFVGTIIKYGVPKQEQTWKNLYSPLFADTETGRLEALTWTPYKFTTDSCTSSDNECEDCTVKIDLSGNAEFESCLRCNNPGAEILERVVWQIEDWHVTTVLRNPRWWTHVGLPEYNRFWSDVKAGRNDPMFLTPNLDFSSVFQKTAFY